MTRLSKFDVVGLALWAANILGAIAIAYLFTVMVMAATAQQDAIAGMKAEKLSQGFSSSFAVTRRANQLDDSRAAELRPFRILDYRQKETRRTFDGAWQGFLPLPQRLSQANLCDITLPADDLLQPREAVLDAVRDCTLEEGASSAQKRQLEAAKRKQVAVRAILDRHVEAYGRYFAAKTKIDPIEDELKGLIEETPDLKKMQRLFSEVFILHSTPLLLGPVFLWLPPAVLQILLTFVSGLFGALLLTLILIVYPKNSIDLKRRGKTWARTFLGGMIALCVYIVLLSGTAVLGATSVSVGAGSNYLAFCGIGILAGMFSDRVAAWLSTRADIFFRQQPPS
jgi:hypothetical protein